MGAFPYYQRGLMETVSPARVRIGADAPVSPGDVVTDTIKAVTAKNRGMLIMNNSDYPFVGFAVFRGNEDPTIKESVSEGAVDDWYGTITDKSGLLYASTWHKSGSPMQSKANKNSPADMLDEFTSTPGEGSASGKVTGPHSGDITIKTPVDKKSKSEGGALIIAGMAGVLMLGLIVSGGKRRNA